MGLQHNVNNGVSSYSQSHSVIKYSIALLPGEVKSSATSQINSGLNFSTNVMELSSKRSHIAGLRCFRPTFLENSKLQVNVRIFNISSRIRSCTSSPTRIQTTRPLRWQLSVEPSASLPGPSLTTS